MAIVISLVVLIAVYFVDSIFYTHSKKNTDLKAWHWLPGAGIFLYFKGEK